MNNSADDYDKKYMKIQLNADDEKRNTKILWHNNSCKICF